jgi:Calcineurin-like phosphoesterase
MAGVTAPVDRVMAISDIHVDMAENMAWLRALSRAHYARSALILAGDVADDLGVLGDALGHARRTFAEVFFVPGNHELWVRRRECADSVEKFRRIVAVCERLGVRVAPARLGTGDEAVWVVPLFTWYAQPEDGPESLFVPTDGEDPTLSMWSDRYFTAWPPGFKAADAFLAMNAARVERAYDAPVISFSHFLPRRDLIFSTPAERAALPRGGIGRDRGADPAPRLDHPRVRSSAPQPRSCRRRRPVRLALSGLSLRTTSRGRAGRHRRPPDGVGTGPLTSRDASQTRGRTSTITYSEGYQARRAR